MLDVEKKSLIAALDEMYPGKWPDNMKDIILQAAKIRGIQVDKGIFDSVQEAGAFLARKWASLESRYGRRAALGIAAGMLATMPIPGSIPVIIAAAETIRGIHGYFANYLEVQKELPESPAVKSIVVADSPFRGRIKSSWYQTKDKGGPCKQGERADMTGCVPAERESGEGRESEEDENVGSGQTPVKKRAEVGKLVAAKREGKGKEARVVLRNGEQAPAHILPSMIPPAWKHVKISMDPEADVLVKAVDAKGGSKTVYHPRYTKNNADAKFSKILEGIKKMDAIKKQNQENRKNPELRENADCIWLMQEQATRPGSDADTKGLEKLYGKPMTADNIKTTKNKKGKISMALIFTDDEGNPQKIPVKDEGTREEIMRRQENDEDLLDSTFWLKSHGATTLEDRHVIETPEGVRLQFVGKEGVWHDHLIRNPDLGKMLLERKKTAKSRGGKIFDTDYDGVAKYSRTLDGGNFTPKDFRTMFATSTAIQEINKIKDCCDSPEDYKKAVMEVATKVSGVLGNRPQQAIESYINPTVWSQWRNPGEENA